MFMVMLFPCGVDWLGNGRENEKQRRGGDQEKPEKNLGGVVSLAHGLDPL
jgi:hypothetical protein